MQKRFKILVFTFLVIALLAVQPTQVSADRDDDDECLTIIVQEAMYLDFDKDGNEDDILTVFEVIPPDDDWEKGRIYISCAVEKPSGDSIGTSFSVYTKDGVEITIVWFNWADESGDYTLYIKAAAYGGDDDDVGPAYIEHVFDPPGGTKPGPPEIELMSVIEL